MKCFYLILLLTFDVKQQSRHLKIELKTVPVLKPVVSCSEIRSLAGLQPFTVWRFASFLRQVRRKLKVFCLWRTVKFVLPQIGPIFGKSFSYALRCVVRRRMKVRWKVLILAHRTVGQAWKSNRLGVDLLSLEVPELPQTNWPLSVQKILDFLAPRRLQTFDSPAHFE